MEVWVFNEAECDSYGSREMCLCWIPKFGFATAVASNLIDLTPIESPEEKEALDMIDTTSKQVEKPNSGQDVYIAQINTLAGVESQRYFIHQYWCDSGHQNQLLKLGILFTDMDKAILKTKSLLGIPHETPEQKSERERLEAAYDLWLTWCAGCEIDMSHSIENFSSLGICSGYLAIVDKTGHRKAK